MAIDPSVDHLALDIDAGEVVVVGVDDGAGSVVVRGPHGPSRFELLEGACTATLEAHCPDLAPSCGFEVEVRLPRNVDQTGMVGTGHVRAVELRGGVVDLLSHAGSLDLRFAEAPAVVFVEALDGDIDLVLPASAYRVDLDGDDVRVDGVPVGGGPSITAWASGNVALRGR